MAVPWPLSRVLSFRMGTSSRTHPPIFPAHSSQDALQVVPYRTPSCILFFYKLSSPPTLWVVIPVENQFVSTKSNNDLCASSSVDIFQLFPLLFQDETRITCARATSSATPTPSPSCTPKKLAFLVLLLLVHRQHFVRRWGKELTLPAFGLYRLNCALSESVGLMDEMK